MLEQYVKKGKELDKEKLATIIELKYKTVADAKKVLGDPKLPRCIYWFSTLFISKSNVENKQKMILTRIYWVIFKVFIKYFLL